MSKVRRIVDIRKSSARKQVDNLKGMVRTPKGLFEGVDSFIKTFREANKETIRTIRGGAKLIERKFFER
jgi:hypothetical protein